MIANIKLFYKLYFLQIFQKRIFNNCHFWNLICSSLALSHIITNRNSKRNSNIFFSVPQTLTQKFTINNKDNQKENTIAQVLGQFANNQIKDSIVVWIQRGLWNLQIKSFPNANNSYHNKSNNDTVKPNMTAVFNANFTMIKPDGSYLIAIL